MFFSRSICRLRSLCRAFSCSAESRCFSNSMFVCFSRSRAGKKALNMSFTTIRPPFFRKYCNAMQCNAMQCNHIYTIVFTIIYIRYHIYIRYIRLAQSVWRVSFSFLSLSSSPVLVHTFFKTNFYFFLKYFHVFLSPDSFPQSF